MVTAPYHITSTDITKLFLTLMKLSVLPLGLAFKYYFAKNNEKYVYFGVLFITFFSNLGLSLLINNSFVQYSVFFLLNMNFTHLLETMASTLLIKAYPLSMEQSFFNQGFMITFFTTLGRFLGSLISYPYYSWFGRDNLTFSVFLTCAVLLAVLFTFSIVLRRDFRVKPIILS